MMTGLLQESYLAELAAAEAAADSEGAFHHLARAHILSQRFTWHHVGVHWRMLKLGAALRDWREVFGQITRMLAAALFSRIWVPVGNTGRADVSAMKPMPIPQDLCALLENNGA
jgi:hypothetical protein